MNLVKTSSLTAVSTVIKIITAFLVNKIIAVYVGPSGLAIIGQFQNFIAIVSTFANGSINNGIVKYTSEYYDDNEKRINILSTSIYISIICSIIVSFLIILFHDYLAKSLLNDVKYSSIIFIFGFTIIIFSLNSFFVSVLNGYKEIRKFIILNILSSIVGLIFTAALATLFGLYGALLSIATAQTVVFFVTIFFVTNSSWFKWSNFIRGVDKESLLKLSKFSLMAIATALTSPVSQIVIRDYITHTISLDAAGFWQGVWRISDIYLMFVTTSLSVYYLPRLSEIKEDSELRHEIFNGYKIILPTVAAIAFIVFLIREPIIHILFTDKFIQMKDLFAFQLIGDFLKIATWLLGFIMIAKSMTRWVIFVEVFFSLSFVLLTIFFTSNNGLIGVTYAFALNYLLCLFFMVYFFRKLLFRFKTNNL